MIAVPWATRLIADLGADVIKVEPPQGDLSRHRGPYPNQPDPSQSGLFTHLNLNKRSVDFGEASDVADCTTCSVTLTFSFTISAQS